MPRSFPTRRSADLIYPEGFDPETGEWLEGYDEQRATRGEQYAKAHARWEAHVKQQAEAKVAEAEAGEATSYSSGGTSSTDTSEAPAATGGSLASDEAPQAPREQPTPRGQEPHQPVSSNRP